jgi:hypothetical protein
MRKARTNLGAKRAREARVWKIGKLNEIRSRPENVAKREESEKLALDERLRAIKRIVGFKLGIELIPSTCFYSNLRNRVTKEVWDKIRKKTYSNDNNLCSVCGRVGELHCHEVWVYDDDLHIQKLSSLVALCKMCHMVKHIGYYGESYALLNHFMNVNRCSSNDFWLANSLAWEIWEDRSSHEWVQDLGSYGGLIKGVKE